MSFNYIKTFWLVRLMQNNVIHSHCVDLSESWIYGSLEKIVDKSMIYLYSGIGKHFRDSFPAVV